MPRLLPPVLLLTACLLMTACAGSEDAVDDAGGEAAEESTTVQEIDPTLSVREIILRQPGVFETPQGRLSIRGSSRPPLIVVDGTPAPGLDVNTISTQDVEQIRILKGPDASIYGVRGGAGVIEITTKRGK